MREGELRRLPADAAPDEMFTMVPAFDPRSAGKSAFVSRTAANGLSAKLACHASSGMGLRRLVEQRAPLYRLAQHTVDTSDLDVEGVSRRIDDLLRGGRAS